MAVQLRLAAGTGPRWENNAVSISRWLLVILDPMISIRKDALSTLAARALDELVARP